MRDWVTPVIDKTEIKPKHFGIWGEPSYPDFVHANEDVSYTPRIRLELRIVPEKEGVTVTCPELELAMCGADELEAWQNFMEAYKDLVSFLLDHEEELDEELKKRLDIVRQAVSFYITKEN